MPLSSLGVQLVVSKYLQYLRYYNALESGNSLILGLNTAKNIDYIKKYFKQKLRRIKFPTKDSGEAYLYKCPRCWSWGSKDLVL